MNETAGVSASSVYDFDRTDPFSIAFRARKTATATGYVVSKVQAAGVRGYGVFLSVAGFVQFDLFNESATPLTVLGEVHPHQDRAWHHVVATWDGDASSGAAGANIYVDGSLGPNRTVVNDSLGSNTISGYVTWVANFDDFAGEESGTSDPPIVGTLTPGSVVVTAVYFD